MEPKGHLQAGAAHGDRSLQWEALREERWTAEGSCSLWSWIQGRIKGGCSRKFLKSPGIIQEMSFFEEAM